MIFQSIETLPGWRDAEVDPPPGGEVVLTKVHDHLYGERDVLPLKRFGRCWFNGDGNAIQPTPTHWRPLLPAPRH